METFLYNLSPFVILVIIAFLIYLAILGLLMPIFVLSIKTDVRRILKILQELQPHVEKYINRPAAYRSVSPPRQVQK